MPSIEVTVASPASPEHPDRFLFKAHKSLPRRTSSANSDGQITQMSPPRHDGHQYSNGLPLTATPILPLTPPGVTLDESPTGVEMQKPTPSRSVIATLTPSRPSHPPTPETTPPRGMTSTRPGLSNFGYKSCSSRADSFQTACEIISDAETETPRASPPILSRSTTQKSRRSTQGNDSFTDARTRETTPTEGRSPSFRGSLRSKDFSTSKHLEKSPARFFQGQELSDGHVSDLRIQPVRNTSKRPRKVADADISGLGAPTRGRKSLRDRVAHVQQSDDSSAIDRFRQQIGWPSMGDRLDPTDPEISRRLSGVSTSSTVEAMIIDTPKPAMRALRHSEKRLSLRSASSPITRSERTSIASGSDLQRRLSHKTARITENDRRSMASDISMSASSTLGAPQQYVDVVPVIVIPQRHSSLNRPSTSTSRNPSVSSQRAPKVPKSRPASLDLQCRKRCTVSDPQASNVPAADRRARSLTRPHVPPRSSSLSAPTSQNNSRTTSLTSNSLPSHSLAVEQATLSRQPPEQSKPRPVSTIASARLQERLEADVPKTQTIVIGVEDLSYLRPPSMQFTPLSIPSSSPGPFEINEVRRVAIFPHNNESLLLVNPQGQSGLREQMPQLQTPDLTQQPTADIDSPLRNPRPPPQPPKFPDQASGSLGGVPEPANPSNRRSGYKRRGWIVRPRSESFNSFVRTLSLSSAKNPKAGEDIDGQLQPFWRPRRFWDDSPESLSPEEDVLQTRNLKQPDEVISNSVGMPQKRIIFDGPTVSPNRPGAKRRLDGYHRAHRETLLGNHIFTPESLYSQTSLHKRQFPAVSWWRLRARSGIARSLRWRLRRSMQQRAEGRRAARRERLKQSIGEAVLVNSSTQVRKTIQ
ncbi:hypothetical protein BJX99DRAFT_9857 [Aspergillus californicus]